MRVLKSSKLAQKTAKPTSGGGLKNTEENEERNAVAESEEEGHEDEDEPMASIECIDLGADKPVVVVDLVEDDDDDDEPMDSEVTKVIKDEQVATTSSSSSNTDNNNGDPPCELPDDVMSTSSSVEVIDVSESELNDINEGASTSTSIAIISSSSSPSSSEGQPSSVTEIDIDTVAVPSPCAGHIDEVIEAIDDPAKLRSLLSTADRKYRLKELELKEKQKKLDEVELQLKFAKSKQQLIELKIQKSTVRFQEAEKSNESLKQQFQISETMFMLSETNCQLSEKKLKILSEKLEECQSQKEVFKEEIYKNIYQAMERDLNCSICDELFIHPVVLKSCSHTYCSYCINKWTQVGDRKCPICRKTYPVELSFHTGLKDFIDKMHELLSPEIQNQRALVVQQRTQEVQNLQAVVPFVPPAFPNYLFALAAAAGAGARVVAGGLAAGVQTPSSSDDSDSDMDVAPAPQLHAPRRQMARRGGGAAPVPRVRRGRGVGRPPNPRIAIAQPPEEPNVERVGRAPRGSRTATRGRPPSRGGAAARRRN